MNRRRLLLIACLTAASCTEAPPVADSSTGHASTAIDSSGSESTSPSTSSTSSSTDTGDLASSSTTGEPACTDSVAATTEDVALPTKTGLIHGVFMAPEGCPPFPTVLLHVGSGPTDRDGNSPLIRGSNDGHLQLAEALQQAGIATLRFDKRGIAASAGALEDPATLVLETYADDLAAWVELLRTDPATIGSLTLLGHSEGSLIATIVAQEAEVDALITVAGPGRPVGDILLDQLAAQTTDRDLLMRAAEIVDALEMGQMVDDIPPELESIFSPSVQGYLISLFARDPAQELSVVDVPTTIVVGTADIQVPVAEGEVLASAAPDAALVVIDGMTHVFKSDEDGQDAAYSDPTVPLATGFVDAIITATAQ